MEKKLFGRILMADDKEKILSGKHRRFLEKIAEEYDEDFAEYRDELQEEIAEGSPDPEAEAAVEMKQKAEGKDPEKDEEEAGAPLAEVAEEEAEATDTAGESAGGTVESVPGWAKEILAALKDMRRGGDDANAEADAEAEESDAQPVGYSAADPNKEKGERADKYDYARKYMG